MKQIKSFIYGLTLSALLAPSVIFAVPTSLDGITRLLTRWQIWFSGVFWIAAVAFIVLAAFKFLTSGGDEKKIGAAKNALLWALVAVAVAIFSTAARPLVIDILIPR